MNIVLNGRPREVESGVTVSGLVAALELAGRRLAVEINEEIVPRSEYPAQRLREGDRVEIVHAIGGG